MTIQRMCQLAKLPRASFYRRQPHKQGADPDLELRDTIQRIALEFPCYGRPRITAELRRRGWVVNPKKVYRILREDNLLPEPRSSGLARRLSLHRPEQPKGHLGDPVESGGSLGSLRSGAFSSRCTTRSGCIRPWAIVRRRSSSRS